MDNRLLLARSITLLYRESQLIQKSENSSDMVRTVIESIQVPEAGMGISSEREILLGLKDTVIEMCHNPVDHEYDLLSLLQRIKLNCGDDSRLLETIESGISEPIQEAQLKRTIINLRKSISNHFREQKIDEVLNKASYQFKFHRDKIKDINQFVMEVLAQLEPLQTITSIKDPAVVADIDLGDERSVSEIFREVKSGADGTGIMKLGWQDLNVMTQGGIRRGETVFINALQHKYKTGSTLSIFAQIALYNIPYMIDKTKKPLLLRISFEDELSSNLQFLYQKLKFDETNEFVDVKNVSVEEMSSYIRQRLEVNGYHVKMLRVDPTQWTYKHICNKIIELEAEGYEIHALMVDYLAKLPRTGCNVTGPMGTDLRDMVRRMRNFCAPKKIAFITPHQLSTDAKMLIRNGMTEANFVKELEGRGFFEGSKQLDQEYDLGLFIHIFKHNKEWWLSIQRDKHRIPTIISDELKYMLLKFPKGMPIQDDINKPMPDSCRKLPVAGSNGSDDLFNFG